MKQRTEIILFVALAGIAATAWHFQRNHPPAAPGAVPLVENRKLLAVESSDLDLPLMEATRRTEYLRTLRNIFTTVAPPEVPKRPPIRPPDPVVPPPPAAPPDPKLPANLKYFGYGTVPNGTLRRAFFTDGEDVYVVSEGETLLGRYRILKIGDAGLQFEEVATGRRGTAPMEEQGQGPSA